MVEGKSVSSVADTRPGNRWRAGGSKLRSGVSLHTTLCLREQAEGWIRSLIGGEWIHTGHGLCCVFCLVFDRNLMVWRGNDTLSL